MKPLRTVKPDPDDPDWTFPYAKRETMEKILVYFENLPNRKEGWKENKHTRALPQAEAKKLRETTRWPSVPPQHRQRVEDWFQMMLARVRQERGEVTPGKLQSLRMNAANYGRYILTGKRTRNYVMYARRKRLLLAYREWQRQEEIRSRPKLQSRRLQVA